MKGKHGEEKKKSRMRFAHKMCVRRSWAFVNGGLIIRCWASEQPMQRGKCDQLHQWLSNFLWFKSKQKLYMENRGEGSQPQSQPLHLSPVGVCKGSWRNPQSSTDWIPWISKCFTVFVILNACKMEANRTIGTNQNFAWYWYRRNVFSWVLIKEQYMIQYIYGGKAGGFLQTHEIYNTPSAKK